MIRALDHVCPDLEAHEMVRTADDARSRFFMVKQTKCAARPRSAPLVICCDVIGNDIVEGETMIKAVVLPLALVAGITNFSNGASAGWQGTVWGMSPEEADKSFRIPHHPAGPVQFDEMAKLAFDTYATGNIFFGDGVLDFKDGGLFEIRMALKWADKCDSLFDVLRGIYGKPETDDVIEPAKGDLGARFTEWMDENHNNRIYLANWRAFGLCDVHYTRYTLPNPSPPPNPPPSEPAILAPGPNGL